MHLREGARIAGCGPFLLMEPGAARDGGAGSGLLLTHLRDIVCVDTKCPIAKCCGRRNDRDSE